MSLSGIAATVDHTNKQTIHQLLERIRHRGPEGEEIYRNGLVQLGEVSFQREYSGRVLQRGYGLVLDGKPFYRKKSLSKDELLEMYLDRGADFVKDLEGKFALALSNGSDIFVARDLFGIKPLYYGRTNNELYFASEMKALINISDSIEIFPPGHFFSIEMGMKRFQDVPTFNPQQHLPLSDAVEKLKNLIFSAVKKAYNSNMKPGIFLSGGVDSSIIAAAARQLSGKKIFTYVAGLEGSPDIDNARLVAEHLGTLHSQYVYSPQEMLEVLNEIIYYLESFDVELINSAIANYFVSKLAQSDDVKVILSGEGADELFGGYHFLKQFKDENELSVKMRELLKGLHNGGFQRVDRMAKAHSLEVEMPFMEPDVIRFALRLPGHWKISEDEMGKWLLRKSFDGELPGETIWRRKAQFGAGSGTENIMHELIDKIFPDEEFKGANREANGLDFKSKEEYYYYRIFKRHFPNKAVEKTVNRWLV